MVVPRTDWRDRADWWSDDLWRDRDGGLSTGEFEGVILRDDAGPWALDFVMGLFAISFRDRNQ